MSRVRSSVGARRIMLRGLAVCTLLVACSAGASTASAQTATNPPPGDYNMPIPQPPEPPYYVNPTPKPSASKALRVSKRADRRVVRAGGLLRYSIRVTNRTGKTVRRVSVCDRLPGGVTVVRRTRPSKLRRSKVCFRRIASIRPRASKRFTLVVRVDRDYRRRVLRNTVSARLSGYRGYAHGRRTVRVKRAQRPRVAGVVVTG